MENTLGSPRLLDCFSSIPHDPSLTIGSSNNQPPPGSRVTEDANLPAIVFRLIDQLVSLLSAQGKISSRVHRFHIINMDCYILVHQLHEYFSTKVE